MSRRAARALGLAAAALMVGYVAFSWWRTRGISPVQRGWMVAFQKGCFTCHGPDGTRGMPNPGHGLGEVPAFTGGMATMYARNEEELREWILDGMPRRIRDDPVQMALRRNATIRMPAWRSMLSERELEDLLAYVKAVSDFERPEEDGARAGADIAQRTGCFNCHGPQGRGSLPSVRAFKGYIPSWDGRDFGVLAQDDREIRLWILDGGTRRLWANPVVRWFLERQPVKMPSYRGHLTEEQVERLIDYIHWLRRHPTPGPSSSRAR